MFTYPKNLDKHTIPKAILIKTNFLGATLKFIKYFGLLILLFTACTQLENALKLDKEKPKPINTKNALKPNSKLVLEYDNTSSDVTPSINLETLSRDSLFIEIAKKDALIDSLYSTIDSLYTTIDDLQQTNDDLSSQVLVNPDFVLPTKVTFAGQEFNLSNERLYQKLQQIYKRELKVAHRFIPRSGKYFAYFDSVFTNYGIPTDVKYLAVAESNLSSMAGSSVGAVGVWQFMKSTARQYKLKVNEFIDERRDVFKATHAAAKYLLDSHKFLAKKGGEDWLLTFCSYNAGVGSIARVMRQQGGKSFFDLILRVNETNEYVWRAVAIKIIFENQEQIFGKKFDLEPNIFKSTKTVELKLNGHYRIDAWAKAQGTVLSKVWELNPWIKIYKQRRKKYSALNNVVLPKGTFKMLLPVNSVPNQNLVAQIEQSFLTANSGFFRYHIVKKGDNLYTIARRYKTSVSKIKALNHMRSAFIKPGQKLKLQGSPAGTYYSTATTDFHTVKPGENLGIIAEKYSISVAQIKQWNNLKNSIIYAKQKLRVRAKKSTPKTTYQNYTGKTDYYTVKSGDYLGKIAQKFNMSISSLKQLNNLSSNNIRIGQKLKVAAGQNNTASATKITYIVKSGDVLSKIAAKHGVSTKSILKANNLSSANIWVGQKLIIESNQKSYTVQSGDTLSGIAKRLNSSIDILLSKNPIKKSSNGKYYLLKPGQTIVY